jgi:hypothetical protein
LIRGLCLRAKLCGCHKNATTHAPPLGAVPKPRRVDDSCERNARPRQPSGMTPELRAGASRRHSLTSPLAVWIGRCRGQGSDPTRRQSDPREGLRHTSAEFAESARRGGRSRCCSARRRRGRACAAMQSVFQKGPLVAKSSRVIEPRPKPLGVSPARRGRHSRRGLQRPPRSGDLHGRGRFRFRWREPTSRLL